MAVTLEELQIKFKSEIAAATSKDQAALARVDAAVRASAKGLDVLRAAHAKNAEAARAAEREQAIADSQLRNAKPEEQAKRLAAARAANARAAKAAAAEEASAARLGAASAKHGELVGAAPELAALAKKKNAVLAEQAAAKQAAAAKRAADKSAAAEQIASAKKAEAEQAAVAKRQSAAIAYAKKDLSAKLKAAAKEEATLAKRAEAEQKAAAKAAERSAARRAAEEKKVADKRRASSEDAATKQIEASQAAMMGAAGAAVALATAIGGAAIATAVFGLSAAGAARDARILADALTGSSALGAEFDAVVTQLASKVPMARGQIADLARELNLMKLGRRDMQAGLTAIAITTSAIGDAAGGVIKGVVQSSAAMKRFTLGARNMWGEYQGLAGSGLSSMDVLSALAKQLGVGVGEVEKRLRLGQVKLKDGLRALEAATQARFGKTIEAQMLSVNTQFTKARENLANMVSGVDLDPALNGLKELLSIFDEGTVAGSALKFLLNEGIGGVSRALGVGLPLAKYFFTEMLIGALELYIAVAPIARKIRDWIEPLLTAENAMIAGKIAIYGIAVAFGLVAAAALAAAAAIMLPFVALWALSTAVSAAWDWLINDAAKAGANLIDSFVGMLTNGADRAMSAARDLANSVSSAFKSALGIASPSKVFAAYGRYTVQGLVQGVEQEAPQAQGAVVDMAPVPPAGGAGGGARTWAGGGATVTIYVGDVYFGGQQATEQEKGGLVEFLKQQIQAGINAAGAGEPLGVPA